MNALDSANTLVVSQKKEWGEILSGFETKNRYVVLSEMGNELYYAAEKSSLLLRLFLKALRPFEIIVARPDGSTVLNLQRPFRFYFHKMDVRDAHGKLLGTIEREFSLLRRLYRITNSTGMEICRLYGPLFHPWTFEIRENDRQVGKITKKWSGLAKEFFTDADNFAIEMPPGKDVETKSVLLGAVFLIDFVHFESKN
ncbi:MAG: phospholipid scramblase-related protein [Acidobacteria bacterium]|nr:phospholipid scramblase-related protein [Acidobacteriota bacterium]